MKSYTDLKQSKKLAGILPLESADMRYGYSAYDRGYDEIPYPKDFLIKNPNYSANEYDAELPCWSLASLFDIIPGCEACRMVESNKWEICSWNDSNFEVQARIEDCDNLIDACYEMIVKLHEQNIL